MHPLDMLTGAEIERAVAIARADGRLPDDALFAHIVLHEPDKALLAQWKAGDPVDREVRLQAVPGPGLELVEVVVSVTQGDVREWKEVSGMRPALLMTEAMNAIFTTKEHPEYLAALARRGITDVDAVQIDPWPAGTFGYAAEAGRRIARCISFLRTDAEDNGYARPDRRPHRALRSRSQRGRRRDRPRRRAVATECRELLRRAPTLIAH